MHQLACLLSALSLVAQVPPTPAPASASAFVEELEPSTLALPIRVNLDALLKQVEAQAPLSPPNVETWAEIKGKPRTYFRFNLIREPLSLRVKDSQVSLRVVANFGMDVGLRTLGNHYTVMGSCAFQLISSVILPFNSSIILSLSFPPIPGTLLSIYGKRQ